MVIQGREIGREYRLRRSESILGREEGVTLRIADDLVSRSHASLKGVWDHPAQPDINIATTSTAPSRIRMSVTSTIGTRGKDDGWRTSHFPWDTRIGAGRIGI